MMTDVLTLSGGETFPEGIGICFKVSHTANFFAKLPEKSFDVSGLCNNALANAHVLYIRLCIALKSEFLISKKHLKCP